MLMLRTVPVNYAYKRTKTPKYFYTANTNIKRAKNEHLYRSITVSESDLDCFSRVAEASYLCIECKRKSEAP